MRKIYANIAHMTPEEKFCFYMPKLSKRKPNKWKRATLIIVGLWATIAAFGIYGMYFHV